MQLRALALAASLAACGGSAPPATSTLTQVQGGPPPASSGEAPPADPRVAADLAAFDQVWQRIADTYYDPTLGGVDWAAARVELRPRVRASVDRAATRAAITALLGKLGKSHFAILPPLDGDADEPDAGGDADLGIDVRVLGDRAIVTRIADDSPARGKLALGDEVVAVDRVLVGERIAKATARHPEPGLAALVRARAVLELLSGAPGSTAVVEIRGRAGKPAVLSLPRAVRGTVATLGNLGAHRITYETRTLAGGIGYIRMSMFMDPPTINAAFARDIAGFASAPGVIIDLRGNPGGIAAMAAGMFGHLIREPGKKLGTMRTRDATLDFVINPQGTPYAGKVAVLVDELSVSTSEIFAGGLQALGRGKVFGRRTPGAALPSVIDVLRNGDRLQYAIADFVSADGKSLEGNGVTPDVPVALDVATLRTGQDPDIVAASRWIKEKP